MKKNRTVCVKGRLLSPRRWRICLWKKFFNVRGQNAKFVQSFEKKKYSRLLHNVLWPRLRFLIISVQKFIVKRAWNVGSILHRVYKYFLRTLYVHSSWSDVHLDELAASSEEAITRNRKVFSVKNIFVRHRGQQKEGGVKAILARKWYRR